MRWHRMASNCRGLEQRAQSAIHLQSPRPGKCDIAMMQLSITTDYVRDDGNPEPYLRRIAEAGMTHIHWCHHWCTDFLYADSEIEQIGRWFADYGLRLNDVHGSEGVEKFWYSPWEYARLAGVELVQNRIDFAARLGADVVVMHVYPQTVAPEYAPFNAIVWDQVRQIGRAHV